MQNFLLQPAEALTEGAMFDHRRECPAITYMAMGFWPRSFPVGGMYVKGIGRLTKDEKPTTSSRTAEESVCELHKSKKLDKKKLGEQMQTWQDSKNS